MDAEELVALYLNAHQAAGRTEQTISYYRHSLTPFVGRLRDHGHSTDPTDWSSGFAHMHGKGKKERYVPFSGHTIKAMQRYRVRGRRTEGTTFSYPRMMSSS